MSIPLTIAGITYNYPTTSSEGWGPDATNWASAITQNTLKKTGGLFTLTADVDFGAVYGIKSLYYKTRSSNISSAGQIRLANTDLISFRNSTNSGNLAFGAGSIDAVPSWNSIDLVNLSTAQTISNKTFTGSTFTGGTFNSPTINTPTVNGGTFSSPSISNGTFSGTSSFTNLSITGNTTIGDNPADTLTINATTSFLAQSLFPNGTLGAPSIAFTSEPSLGIYRGGSNLLSVAVAGANVWNFSATYNESILPLRLVNGTAALPALSFRSDSTTGIYLSGGTGIGFSISTTQVGDISSAGAWTFGATAGTAIHTANGYFTPTIAFRAPNGSASVPSYSFTNQTDQGMYLNSNTDLTFNFAGTDNKLSGNTATSAILELQLRASSGRGPYFSIVENAVANRWAIGSDAGSATLNFRQATPTGTVTGSVNSNGLWTLGASGGSQTHQINSNAIAYVSSASLTRTEDSCTQSALTDNTTDGIVFSYTAASNNSIIVEYGIKRGSNYETGSVLMVTDGTTVQMTSFGTVDIGDVGTTLNANINSGNIRLLYTTTSTGTSGTIRYNVRRWAL
ncbi:MAG: hypothetical protein SGJ04_01285 [Bacteroidota bacterium]|nr:hypothetical protein [Bacteroidota bacterium]